MFTIKDIKIERHAGGWLVHTPDGDYAWQPSEQFAKAYAREWLLKRLAQ